MRNGLHQGRSSSSSSPRRLRDSQPVCSSTVSSILSRCLHARRRRRGMSSVSPTSVRSSAPIRWTPRSEYWSIDSAAKLERVRREGPLSQGEVTASTPPAIRSGSVDGAETRVAAAQGETPTPSASCSVRDGRAACPSTRSPDVCGLEHEVVVVMRAGSRSDPSRGSTHLVGIVRIEADVGGTPAVARGRHRMCASTTILRMQSSASRRCRPDPTSVPGWLPGSSGPRASFAQRLQRLGCRLRDGAWRVRQDRRGSRVQ